MVGYILNNRIYRQSPGRASQEDRGASDFPTLDSLCNGRIAPEFSPDRRGVLSREDIIRNMMGSGKYDFYTAEGAAAIDPNSDATTKSVGEFWGNSIGKLQKSGLRNVSANS